MMAGYGRHVPTYKKLKPKSITIVDFNALAIKKAVKEQADIEAVSDELINWISNEESKYKVAVGMWCLCYLEE